MKIRILLLSLLMLLGPARAAEPGDHAIALPSWFSETFLDFKEEIRDAAKTGRRLMVYFGQDGCPYCKELMQTNFSQKAIADKARAHFTAIALNIWGDREVTWTDGRKFSEKQFAAFLKVQFTPTLLFFDEKGEVAVRLNGYYPPHRFDAVLDYVAGRMEARLSLAEHLKAAVKESANPALHDEPFFLNPPYDLRRRGKKPLAVLFETRFCAACDELHREGFKRKEVQALVARFDVARFALPKPCAWRRKTGRAPWESRTRPRSCSSTRAAKKCSASKRTCARFICAPRSSTWRAKPTSASRASSVSCRAAPGKCARRANRSISGASGATFGARCVSWAPFVPALCGRGLCAGLELPP
jgi:thioredoxin-related protein